MKKRKLPREKQTKGFKRDKEGFLYVDHGKEQYRVTECCKATVTFSDDVLCCKECWEEVPLEFAGNPVL